MAAWAREHHPCWGEQRRQHAEKMTTVAAGASAGASAGTAAAAVSGRNDWLTSDAYAILGVPVDFEHTDSLQGGGGGGGVEVLKKAYRSATKRLHPDKPGGSEHAFTLAVTAHEVSCCCCCSSTIAFCHPFSLSRSLFLSFANEIGRSVILVGWQLGLSLSMNLFKRDPSSFSLLIRSIRS
jgi:hypothetical protein